jgi:hypothetical protein
MLFCLRLNFNPAYGNHLIQSMAVIVSPTARGHALSSAWGPMIQITKVIDTMKLISYSVCSPKERN